MGGAYISAYLTLHPTQTAGVNGNVRRNAWTIKMHPYPTHSSIKQKDYR